jgi:hypothetical protein
VAKTKIRADVSVTIGGTIEGMATVEQAKMYLRQLLKYAPGLHPVIINGFENVHLEVER